MVLNILQADPACHTCIKGYAKKHSFKKGQVDKDGKDLGFDIDCRGIPIKYVRDNVYNILDGELDPEIMLDPVKWAAAILDWHCLDEDKQVWARKNPDEYIRYSVEEPERLSKYHRPYQALMLRCSAKYKVFRCGRQIGKSECLVVSILFQMFTNSNFKIVLVTPYQSQIDLIFKRLENLIQNSTTLQNSIKRSVKAPQYTIELHNGSQIKGFTAGSKSNANAGSVRGQDANMLVFDEADYLNREDLDSAMAIITNYPDATVWMSSTPTGRREKFYETCGDRSWKEFYYPSHVNPNWTPKLDGLYQKQLTSIGYKHEILAEFGEQEEGIFQAGFVEAALDDYNYKSMRPVSSWLYSIGVDWNSSKWGTCIYVMGYDPANHKFLPVEHHVVKRDGWTQTDACMKIIELHRKWKPFACYVDQGYGATQIEILHKYGADARMDPERGPNHIDARLTKTIVPYDFGTTIETRDLFTKQKMKKPAKGFLVENAVRRFENNEMLLPKEDEQIRRELLAYVIKNVSQTGQVSYMSLDANIGDHNLDALMLSLVAYTLEKSQLGKVDLVESIQFSSIEKVNGERSIDPITEQPTNSPKSFRTARKEQKPSSSRNDIKSVGPTRPAPSKVWNWPGFSRDEPHPWRKKGPGGGRNSF